MQKPDEGKAKAVADLERRLAMLGNVDEPLPPPAFEALPPPSMSPPPPPAYNNMSAPMAPPPPAYQFSAPPPPAYQFSAPSMPPPAVEAPPAASIAKPASAAAATAGSSRSGKDALMARIQAAKEKAQKEKAAKATPPPPAPPAYHAPPPSMPMAPPSMPMAPPAYDAMPPSYDAMPPPPPPPSSPPAFDSMAFPPPPPIDAVAPPPLPSYMATPAASAPSFESLHTIQDDAAPQNNQHNHYANLHAMPPPAAAPAMDADILAALDPAEREQILEEQRQMLAQFENKNSTSKQPLSASDPEDFDVAKAMAQFDDLDAQMQEDMKVAEELQKKEYGTAINAKSVAEKKKKASEAQSWYSWMTGKEENENDNNNAESSSKSKSSRSSSSEYPANTTSTSTSASTSRGPRLVAAQTGDETPSVSRDDDDDAKKGGLFASAFGTPQEEATLVAVPQFSRQRN